MGECSQAPAALTPGEKCPPLPAEQKVSVSQSQSWHFGDYINLLSLHGFEPKFFGGADRRVVTVLSDLHRPFVLDYKQERCQWNIHSSCVTSVHKVPDDSARLTVPAQLQWDTNSARLTVPAQLQGDTNSARITVPAQLQGDTYRFTWTGAESKSCIQ